MPRDARSRGTSVLSPSQKPNPSGVCLHGEARRSSTGGGGEARSPPLRGRHRHRCLAGGVHLYVQRRNEARMLPAQGARPAAREAGRGLTDPARRGGLPLRLRREVPLRALPS